MTVILFISGVIDGRPEMGMLDKAGDAQYYLTRFHSNLNWRINPVCVLCFRMSAFLLPGLTPLISVKEIPKDMITQNTITGERYRIDSVYVNSDICTGIEDVRKWFTSGVIRSIWEA